MATGRPPKPVALKVLEGNPGKRRLPNGPKPQPLAPTCPAWLAAEARREWRRLAPELERLGLLTRIDRAALAAYCQAYARWRQAEEVLQCEGLTFTTGKGYVGSRPEIGIANKAMAIIKGFCGEFGLTPSSRGRMNLPEPETDDLEQLLRGSG